MTASTSFSASAFSSQTLAGAPQGVVGGARGTGLNVTAHIVTDERVALFEQLALFRDLGRGAGRLGHRREIAGNVPA